MCLCLRCLYVCMPVCTSACMYMFVETRGQGCFSSNLTPLVFFKGLFTFILCVRFFFCCMHSCSLHACHAWCSWRPKRISGFFVFYFCDVVWEVNLGSLQEYQVLLTVELSLQPYHFSFWESVFLYLVLTNLARPAGVSRLQASFLLSPFFSMNSTNDF